MCRVITSSEERAGHGQPSQELCTPRKRAGHKGKARGRARLQQHERAERQARLQLMQQVRRARVQHAQLGGGPALLEPGAGQALHAHGVRFKARQASPGVRAGGPAGTRGARACGSTSRGQRWLRIAITAFPVKWSSSGRPCRRQARTVAASARCAWTSSRLETGMPSAATWPQPAPISLQGSPPAGAPRAQGDRRDACAPSCARALHAHICCVQLPASAARTVGAHDLLAIRRVPAERGREHRGSCRQLHTADVSSSTRAQECAHASLGSPCGHGALHEQPQATAPSPQGDPRGACAPSCARALHAHSCCVQLPCARICVHVRVPPAHA